MQLAKRKSPSPASASEPAPKRTSQNKVRDARSTVNNHTKVCKAGS